MTFIDWINERYGSSMLPADKYDELESCYSCGYKQGQVDLQSQLDEKDRQIEELQKDMITAIPLLEKAECQSCVYTDSPCVPADYDKKENGHCDHYKNVFDELTEKNKEIKELRVRLSEHESIGNSQFWKNVWTWKLKVEQFDKVKDVLKRLVDLSNNSRSLLGGTWHETIREAEDLLSEVEE